MSKKCKNKYWESDCTAAPLFTTAMVACCFLKYSPTPNNVRYAKESACNS